MSPPGNLYASTLVRLRAGDPPAADAVAGRRGGAAARSSQAYAPDACGSCDQMAERPACRRRQAGRHPARARSDDAVIVGFGVNLAEHPTDLERPATSLRRSTGARARPGAVRRAISPPASPLAGALARRGPCADPRRAGSTRRTSASARRSRPPADGPRRRAVRRARRRGRAAAALGGWLDCVSSTPATSS